MSNEEKLVSIPDFQLIMFEGIRICGSICRFGKAVGLAPGTIRDGLQSPSLLSPLSKAKILDFGRRNRLWPFELDPALLRSPRTNPSLEKEGFEK